MARTQLPPGRQFALTWSIPDDFGGMTSALLHRSRAFVRLGGSEVDVLTFDDRPDYDQVERRLRASGEMIEGMRLLNLWGWFREHGTEPRELRHPFTPLAPTGERVVRRLAADGTVLQLDRYRDDGTLFASDRRDVLEPGVAGGRSIVLCDERGEPVRSWGGAWSFYRAWLDQLRRHEPSFLIVDSKTVARFAATYRRKRAVVVHVVHNSHLAGGELRASRREVFENLRAFDSVVLLSERQRGDIERGFGRRDNLAVIPNARQRPRQVPLHRERSAGIVVASVDSRKRVDHAVRALPAGATLEVFGDGPKAAELAQLVRRLGLESRVRLHGHTPNARERLRSASFLLLTSRSEGFPLVLVEAMAAGCLPIAYDIDYGPSDLIRHRRNGFLVEPGDIAGLSAAIQTVLTMDERRLVAMRRSARRTAAAFSDEAITRRWARELAAAERRKLAAWPAEQTG